MPRTVEAPNINEHGDEVHPAFGQIGVTRRSSTPGAVLFDSDIRHGHSMVLQVSTASRHRDLNRDWIYGGEQLIEVEMSEAQWAGLVSSVNTSGVPCTLRAREGNHMLPELPYDPRLAHSMDEVKGAAEKYLSNIKAAMDKVDALDPKAGVKDRRAALNNLRIAINNATPNITYVAKSLTEHAENVVQRSRADIEAMAVQTAERMGLPTGTRLVELTTGEENQRD